MVLAIVWLDELRDRGATAVLGITLLYGLFTLPYHCAVHK